MYVSLSIIYIYIYIYISVYLSIHLSISIYLSIYSPVEQLDHRHQERQGLSGAGPSLPQ